MKIKTTVTEIECTTDELKQSNTLADSFCNLLRSCFNHTISDCDDLEDDEAESEDKQ